MTKLHLMMSRMNPSSIKPRRSPTARVPGNRIPPTPLRTIPRTLSPSLPAQMVTPLPMAATMMHPLPTKALHLMTRAPPPATRMRPSLFVLMMRFT